MRIAYFDCFSGISGDMMLGAFVDAGLPLDKLKKELSSLNIDDEFHLEERKMEKCSICGTKVDVIPAQGSHHHHHHRRLPDIIEIINSSELDEWCKSTAINIFKRLAEAEAKVHNMPVEQVHFHEIGAVDSIVDIVGSAVALKLLEVEKLYCSALPLGGGIVNTAHGKMPLPAPATAELLKDVPVYRVDSEKELVTPTGAAVVSELAGEFSYFPPVKWEHIGYGCGSAEREMPNMLRIFIGNTI